MAKGRITHPKASVVNDEGDQITFVWTNLIGPNTSEVSLIKAEADKAEYDGMTDKQIARELVKRPLVANPVAQADVPDRARFNAAKLLGMLAAAGALGPGKIPEDSLQRVGDDIRSDNFEEIEMALTVWRAKGYIDDSLKTAMEAEVKAVIPDPNYKTQVPGTSKLDTILGRTVGGISANEVKYARQIG